MQSKKLTNQELSKYKKLQIKKFRQQEKQFLIEGLHLIKEAANNNILKLVITSNLDFKLNDVEIKYTSYKNISKLSSTKTAQPYVGVCNFLETRFEKNGTTLILNKINDPGNLGTIIRTAKAFDFKNIIIDGVDLYNPKVLRSAQGAIFAINVFNSNDIINEIKKLKSEDYLMIGSFLDKEAINYNELNFKKFGDKNLALILGNEANGIEKDVEKLIDIKVYIPIKFESLNVAVAGGILMNWIDENNNKK